MHLIRPAHAVTDCWGSSSYASFAVPPGKNLLCWQLTKK